MSWVMASKVRGTLTRTAVAAAIAGGRGDTVPSDGAVRRRFAQPPGTPGAVAEHPPHSPGPNPDYG